MWTLWILLYSNRHFLWSKKIVHSYLKFIFIAGARGQLPLAFIFAIVTIALAVVLEILQLIRYRWAYFKELRNYGELLLYILSIIHAFVFFNECGCPLVWQWQIGIFAVLLGWMNLIAYAARFPRTGIYVLIFYKILTTFLKLISFSILLVLGFSVILFMTFNDPNSEVINIITISISDLFPTNFLTSYCLFILTNFSFFFF